MKAIVAGVALAALVLACSEGRAPQPIPPKKTVPVEKAKTSKPKAKTVTGTCQTFAGGFPGTFSSGCIGKRCYKQKCGSAQLRLKSGGSARISYNCREGVNARWQTSGSEIVVTGKGDPDFYCGERCGQDPECLEECYGDNIDEVGHKIVSHKFRYRLRHAGDKISVVNEHYEVSPRDAQIPKDSYFHGRSFKCLYELK